ncbi:MAG: nucleoside triphosphate pyrophosphohydrolase [Hyphomicrobiales bacterium]
MSIDDDYRDLEPSGDIARLLEIMGRLRDPETGCPQDIIQTFKTIVPYTIEEAYEVKDAIERDDMNDLCDELGDLLLQVVYHAEMASERGAFNFEDVVKSITKKMIRRHPHVFGTNEQRESGMKEGDWERIKTIERAEKEATKSAHEKSNSSLLLDSVPNTLPALTHAMKLQKRASTVGFDWNNIDLVFDKLREEFAELEAECAKDDSNEQQLDEMGDILFVAVNLARHLKIDPEVALNSTNSKFIKRFNFIENALNKKNKTLENATLEEMEALWQAAKNAKK